MKKLVIAFHLGMVDIGDNRGALRLFRAIIAELAKREDIEFRCLGERISGPSNPVGSIYEYVETYDWLKPREPRPSVSRPRPRGNKHKVVYSEKVLWLQTGWHRARRILRDKIPEELQIKFQPVARTLLHSASYILTAAGLRTVEVEAFDQMIDPVPEPFTNDNIVGKAISLDDIDVLINFWWFHSPRPNPMLGVYRPPKLRVLSWFLDAIPLRVAHWQPGFIPIELFRNAVQHNLELADEIVTISQSAANDIAVFFPHIKKPIHVMPCGVFEDDFIEPLRRQSQPGQLTIDPHVHLFCLIGAIEPSKNVVNILRATISVAEHIGKPVQVAIVGPADNDLLKQLLGPYTEKANHNLKVIFAGAASDETKRFVLAKSAALIYASKWEGFGIPPLEAMAARVPIVASDIPALRESCLDVAILCDPYDPEDIASAILQTINMSAAEKAARLDLGYARAKSYSWRAAADILVKSIAAGGVQPR